MEQVQQKTEGLQVAFKTGKNVKLADSQSNPADIKFIPFDIFFIRTDFKSVLAAEKWIPSG
jgi:hypothetical protein